MRNDNEYRVYGYPLAKHLIAIGYKMLFKFEREEMPGRYIMVFENTPELLQEVEKYESIIF